MATAVLTISSKNYSSWSLRGWLLCKMAGLEFHEEVMSADDPSTRAELLLLSPSFLVPGLVHEGIPHPILHRVHRSTSSSSESLVIARWTWVLTEPTPIPRLSAISCSESSR